MEKNQIEVVAWSTPPENFITYTPWRTEKVIPAYSKRVIEHTIRGPIILRDPNAEVRSIITLGDMSEGYPGGRQLMILANGELEWSATEQGRSRITVRHSFARDDENDQSELVRLNLASVQITAVYGGRIDFEAWIVKANFYEEGDSGKADEDDDSPDIFTAVRKEDDPDYYANAGYPYLGPEKDSILGRNLPLRVKGYVYSYGYEMEKTFEKWVEQGA